MPVTTKPASHGASLWSGREAPMRSDMELLNGSCPQEFENCQSVIQSSFSELGSGPAVYSSSNGFVYGVTTAYNDHHHLAIRPEDVWFSILTQLNLFINAHAEQVRSTFVSHQGQKALEVTHYGSRDTYNFGKLAEKMASQIKQNIIDPSLYEWVMPDFTTTTDTDKVVASVIMMGTLQKYFDYQFAMLCGLPSVTLLGEKADWESILVRIERLPQMGPELVPWHQLLKPVITHFVRTFDSPDAPETREFWQKVAHYESDGSGPTYLSGWITAFCFWNESGKSLFPAGGITLASALVIDGVPYHQIDTLDIPPGVVSVPVKVNDQGDKHDTIMVAGSVGFRVTSSGGLSTPWRRWYGNQTGPEEPAIGLDTIQPESGWWIIKKNEEDEH